MKHYSALAKINPITLGIFGGITSPLFATTISYVTTDFTDHFLSNGLELGAIGLYYFIFAMLLIAFAVFYSFLSYAYWKQKKYIGITAVVYFTVSILVSFFMFFMHLI